MEGFVCPAQLRSLTLRKWHCRWYLGGCLESIANIAGWDWMAEAAVNAQDRSEDLAQCQCVNPVPNQWHFFPVGFASNMTLGLKRANPFLQPRRLVGDHAGVAESVSQHRYALRGRQKMHGQTARIRSFPEGFELHLHPGESFRE
jgi:hypothetical protein